jgi:phospholipid/cholesterol/gamma-HCH transport system substrate-binding protein
VIQFVRRSKLPPSELPPKDTDSTDARHFPTFLTSAQVPAAQPQAQPAPKGPSVNPNDVYKNDDWIEGVVAPNVFQVFSGMQGDVNQAINSLSNAGDEVSKLAARINGLLETNDDQITRIVDKTEQTLDTFQKALANFDDVFGNPQVRENLRKSIDELPLLLSDTRSAMGTIRTTVESVDRNLVNLEGITGPLGERGEEIVTRADQALARLDTFLAEMSDFGQKLNSGEGSLGKIMRDPDLYQSLLGASRNLEQITCQLKPIVADARVFADKIARHPEVLGVRGAISRSPGTK